MKSNFMALEKRMFHIADPKDIKAGKLMEVYFVRTMEILKAKKILYDLPTPQVIREYVLNQLPHFDL